MIRQLDRTPWRDNKIIITNTDDRVIALSYDAARHCGCDSDAVDAAKVANNIIRQMIEVKNASR